MERQDAVSDSSLLEEVVGQVVAEVRAEVAAGDAAVLGEELAGGEAAGEDQGPPVPDKVEDVYALTGGCCTCHPTFAGECPVDWCRHHLDCQDRGTWKDLPRRRPDGSDTCSLRIAERGDHTLESVAIMLGLTRERVRQIEERAVAKAGMAYLRLDLLGRSELGEERIASLRASRYKSFRCVKRGDAP